MRRRAVPVAFWLLLVVAARGTSALSIVSHVDSVAGAAGAVAAAGASSSAGHAAAVVGRALGSAGNAASGAAHLVVSAPQAMRGGCPNGGHGTQTRRGTLWRDTRLVVTFNGRPPPPPQKLPHGWEAVWSKFYGAFYYWSCARSATAWKLPAEDAVPPPPPRRPAAILLQEEASPEARQGGVPPPPPRRPAVSLLQEAVPPPPPHRPEGGRSEGAVPPPPPRRPEGVQPQVAVPPPPPHRPEGGHSREAAVPPPPPRRAKGGPSEAVASREGEAKHCGQAPPPPPRLGNGWQSGPPPRHIPAGWLAVWSRACQEFYYVHNATGDRTWTLPPSDQAAALLQPRPPAERPPSPRVPDGWQAIWSEASQGYYYWHHASGNATWELPEPDDQPIDTGYRPGENAMVRVEDGMARGLWVPCVVLGEGLQPFTYDIHVPDLPPDRQEVFDVRIRALRKVRPGYQSAQNGTGATTGNGTTSAKETEAEAREEERTRQDYRALPLDRPAPAPPPVHQPSQDYHVLSLNRPAPAPPPAHQPGQDAAVVAWIAEAVKRWHAARPPEPYKPGLFEPLVGEIMDVEILVGPNKGTWAPCRVTGAGAFGGTYNIKMPVSGPVLAYIRDVPLWWLRKSTSPEAVLFRHINWDKRVERLRR